MDKKEAHRIYAELKKVSEEILAKIGCLPEPTKPRDRRRPWRNGEPRGILYHYTGGVSGLKSMKWANHPGWGNEGSSWHVTIFDRIPTNAVGNLWIIKTSQELKKLFPVPVIIMADWKNGTWHGNWTNDMTLGVENRNSGYSGWYKLGSDGIAELGKVPVVIGGRKWEPYTREQLVANINLGRLVNGYVDGRLDPDWVLPHSAVWASKADTGLHYPLHLVRNEIFSNSDLYQQDWLSGYELAPDDHEDDELWFAPSEEGRNEDKIVAWITPDPYIEQMPNQHLANSLYAMGFNCGPDMPSPEKLVKSVKMFQQSTRAWKQGRLNPDGIAGAKTETAIKKRLEQLKLEI